MNNRKLYCQLVGMPFILLLGSVYASAQYEQSEYPDEYSQDIPILYYDSENDLADYRFEITTEACTSECDPPPCNPCPEPPCLPPLSYRFLADTGYLYQPESADYLFGRVGIEYHDDKEFSALAMLGGAPKIGGDEGKSAFTVDVLGQYNWSKYFLGMGVGAWLTSGDDDFAAEDSGLDFITNIGTRIEGGFGGLDMSIFLEARSALDELDEIMDYGRFGIGLRFRF